VKEQEVSVQMPPQPEKSELEENIAPENEDFIACYRCNGSKINKKGRTCRKCEGTGVISN
jgi:DnaJ-class molecular chaperone